MKTAVRSALVLPGLVAASSLVPTSFGVADPDGIWSLQTNPAGLGRMNSWEAGAFTGGNQTQGQDAVAAGWNGIAAGWDRLPGPVDPLVRVSDIRLGVGTDLGRGLYAGAMGLRHQVDGTTQGWSVDLGLLWQPTSRICAGWILPNWQGRDASRSGGNALALALRPSATLDLQVGVETWLSGPAWMRSSWDAPTWEVAARIRPLPWLALDGRVDPEHPERLGFAVSVQVVPNLSAFARSAPAPQPSKSEFQAFGLRYAARTRPAPVATSPLMVYKVPADLGESDPSRGIWRIRDDFREMASVKGLETVVLDLGTPSWSPAAAGELRRQVLFLRSRGVAVWAWARDLDMGTLSVLSAADHAAIDPQGMVRARGFSMDVPYLGGTLRRHGVRVQVVKTGPWKSAMEPFESDRMSQAAREDLQRFLLDVDSIVLAGVVQGRRADPAALVAYIDTGSALARSAVRAKLVDTLLDESEIAAWAGVPRRGAMRLPLKGEAREEWGSGRRVVVLQLDGQVVDRDGEAGMVPWSSNLSAQSAVREVERLTSDPSVGAVVLRINSPGGAVSGSDRLRRAIERLAASKPVAASFGSVAASGAYLFSLPAARIWAEPEAMVGSIGAFAAKADVAGLLDSLGIRIERVETAPHAAALSPFAPFDSLEAARVAEFVEDAHREFAAHVMAARHMDSAAFRSVDGGRVFSGVRAAEVGLVDSVGGVEAAVAWARGRAGIPAGTEVEWRAPVRRGLFARAGAVAQAAVEAAEGPRDASFGKLMDLLRESRTGVWAQSAWEPLRE